MKCFLNIVSVNKNVFCGYIKKIYVPGFEGVLNIYPGHSPLLTSIHSGLLYVLTDKSEKMYFYISNGFLEVQPNNINVLTEYIVSGQDLNYSSLVKKKKDIIFKIQNCNINTTKKILQVKLLVLNKKIQVINVMNKN